MNLNKLYFVEKYGEDWKNQYHKWIFTEKMRKIGDIYKVDMKREWVSISDEPTKTDHATDAMSYMIREGKEL
jgi:hypothetical protein